MEPITVLVVDDEAIDRDFIKKALEVTCGFTVLSAGSYQEAAEVFDAHATEITLLLADISLPGKTGLELAKALLRKMPNLKVLLMSGWVGAASLRFQGIPPTDLHFLPKPFRYTELIDRIKTILASDEPVAWLLSNGTDSEHRQNT